MVSTRFGFIDQDLVIMTQSCDLENGKAPVVACCPIYTLDQFEQVNPKFRGKGEYACLLPQPNQRLCRAS